MSIIIGGAKGWYRNSAGKYEFHDMTESMNSIRIERFSTAAAVLSNFGHLIKHIRIQKFPGWSRARVKQILTLINLPCAETLEKIQFINTEHDIFDELTMPFKSLEEVILASKSGYKKLNSSEFSFGKMFPITHSIYLDSHKTLNTDSKNYVMTHLEYIHIRTEDSGLEKFNETLFGNLVKSNPQIKNISITDCNAGMLNFLPNEALNLENLGFDYYDNTYDDEFTNIRFEKLKKIENWRLFHQNSYLRMLKNYWCRYPSNLMIY